MNEETNKTELNKGIEYTKVSPDEYGTIVEEYKEGILSGEKKVVLSEKEAKSGLVNQGTDPNSRMVLLQEEIAQAKEEEKANTIKKVNDLRASIKANFKGGFEADQFSKPIITKTTVDIQPFKTEEVKKQEVPEKKVEKKNVSSEGKISEVLLKIREDLRPELNAHGIGNEQIDLLTSGEAWDLLAQLETAKNKQPEPKMLVPETPSTQPETPQEVSPKKEIDTEASEALAASLTDEGERKFYNSLTLEEQRSYRPSWAWDKKIFRLWIEFKRSPREKLETLLKKITSKSDESDKKLADKKLDKASQAFMRKVVLVTGGAIAIGLGGIALKNQKTTDNPFDGDRPVTEAASKSNIKELKVESTATPAKVKLSKTHERAQGKVSVQATPKEVPTILTGFDLSEMPTAPAESKSTEDSEAPTKLVGIDPDAKPAENQKQVAAEEFEVVTQQTKGGSVAAPVQERTVSPREKMNSIYQKHNIRSLQNIENLDAAQIQKMVFERSGGFAQTPLQVDEPSLWNDVIDRGVRSAVLQDMKKYLIALQAQSGLALEANESFMHFANRAEENLATRGIAFSEAGAKNGPEVERLKTVLMEKGRHMRTIPANVWDMMRGQSASQFLKNHVQGDTIISGTWEFGARSADPRVKDAEVAVTEYLLALKKLQTQSFGEYDAAPKSFETIEQYIYRLNAHN